MSSGSPLERVRVEAADYQPSPDLFSRLTVSIEEDRLHRRRVRTALLLVTVLAGGCAALGAATVGSSDSGVPVMPRWAMEVMETAVLAVIIFSVGPALRRFGVWLVRDLFHGDESAGRFLAVLDVAYYLLFVGLLLTGVRLVGLGNTAPVTELLDEARIRMASLLLAMGLLHAVSLAALPLVALVRSSIHWNLGHREAGTVGQDRTALAAERLVKGLFVLAGVAVMVAMLVAVVATVVLTLG